MPACESLMDYYRDWAILQLYLRSDIRLSSGSRLNVSDFQYDEDEATIRPHEKATGAGPLIGLGRLRQAEFSQDCRKPRKEEFELCVSCGIYGAGEGTRTPDPLITNQMLYQLSYTGLRTGRSH
jgi:hypothetical protein